VGALGPAASLPVSAELAEELANLRRVQEALRAGRGAEALRLLDAGSSRLDQGQLRQERLAAEVFAACQSGEVERARRAARRFLDENPATPSAARLQSSCVGAELGR
jgi:outer membrane protein assembly factor BamD (BamD/ComL family)